MGSLDTTPAYKQQAIEGKGQGLVATRSLKPGDLILSEPPLFTTASLTNPATFEKDLGAIVKGLPKDGQRAFLSLHNNNPGSDPFSNIVRSNGYPLGPDSDVGAIFPLVARLNHACRPNAQHTWNAKRGVEVVHAVREVKEGEELTLSYSMGGPSEERRGSLEAYFGFDCKCEVCSLPQAELEASDARLREAQKLDEAIGDPRRVRHLPERALADCKALLGVYREEGIFDLRLPRLDYDAFQIAAMHSDAARASAFAKLCAEARTVCEGEESEEVVNMRALEAKPASFPNWGATKKWKSKIEDVPKDADANAFEKWLWKEAA
ncbi:hypothetical protein WHR41_06041 [Cladosporium halotolerans]|uniref:SET domain-containing protein n=1 Tax=Cladosporium halotolerans TaxID=1052096 RepID=A0AB34KPA6_9PEZI